MEQKQLYTDLLAKKKNIFSKNGEDGLMKEIVKRIPTNKWFVELEASDGKYHSNTYNLAYTTNDWKGLYIGSDKTKYKNLVSTCSQYKKRLFSMCSKIDRDKNKLDNILLCFESLPKDFDILSIYNSPNNYEIWESVTRYNPKIVVIEPNLMADNIQESFVEMVELGKRKGYSMLVYTGNLIFINIQYLKYFPEIQQ